MRNDHAALSIFAHPDDESFQPGGTLAFLARGGVQVQALTVTWGEAGACGDPPLVQVVARLLPSTCAVEASRVALFGGSPALAALDLLALAGFTAVLFILAARVLAQRVA